MYLATHHTCIYVRMCMYVYVYVCTNRIIYVCTGNPQIMFTRNLSVRTKVLVDKHDGGRNDPRLGIK